LKSLYDCFTTFRQLIPAAFQSEEFGKQFSYYSSLISSILSSREAIIDFISNLSFRKRTSGAHGAPPHGE
jgi:hypothetical protein